MSTWSENFDAYVSELGLGVREVARQLNQVPSAIVYWRRGSVPREITVRRQIARWSKGRVPADPEPEPEVSGPPSKPPPSRAA